MELTKNLLENLYINERLSTWAIEKKLGVSRSRVFSTLKRFGIPTRNIAQSHILYPRKDFSGDLVEKAYLVGFAMGDLRVRKNGGAKCETIGIGCASTKDAQIELFKNLFSKYGTVWAKKVVHSGKTNFEVRLNSTFAFLHEKRSLIDPWIFQESKTVLAFIGGFVDAEGSFFISARNRATFSLGNYNLPLLIQIKESLERFGIQLPQIINDHLKGYVGKEGYRRKQDYHHLACTKKETLVRFIKLLKPYLRHSDKLERAEKILLHLE